MDSGEVTQLVIILILILFSAFFSSAETAYTTVNKVRMRSLSDAGNKRAKKVLKVIENPSKLLRTLLISNNIVNISASSLATILSVQLLSNIGVGIAIGIITLLILVFGEIIPKTYAKLHAEKIVLSYIILISSFMLCMTPLIFIVDKLSEAILKLFRVEVNAKNNAITEDELRTIVDVSHEDGILENEERKMIYNVVDFGDSLAKDIMVPRIDITFLDVDCTYQELIEVYKEVKFTRLPVYEDTTDNVIGIINVKDLLLYDSKHPFHIRDFFREPYFTYEYKKISELLMEMRQSSINFAIVLDEYGATAGLITLEDLLEEIVGEIRDEYDTDEEDLVMQINDREYLIEGSMKLDDMNEILNLHITSDDYDSIGGIIIELLDHLPETGEEVTTQDGIRLVAEKVDKKRIEKVHLYLPEEPLTITEINTDDNELDLITNIKE